MISRPLLGALLIVCSTLSASAQGVPTPGAVAAVAASPQPHSALPSPVDAPLRFTLGNGLRVVLQRDTRQPRVAISVVYGVGSRDDPKGYRGLAHLVEHLMFEGSSDQVKSDYFEQIESAGTTAVNGTTARDVTSYFHELPRAQLGLGLWLEAARMAYLLKWLDLKDLERARIAVIREWESHVESSARAGMEAYLDAALYPSSHPYHHAHDDPDDVAAVQPSDVQWFFQRWYGPGNATLAVAGDFEPEAARREIEARFGAIMPAATGAVQETAPLPVLSGRRELEIAWSSSSRTCDMVWLTPPLEAADDLVLDVLTAYLSLELDALVADDAVLQSAHATYLESGLAGEIHLQWSTDPESEGGDKRAAIEALLAKVRAGSLDQTVVLRARESLRQSYVFADEHLVGRSLRLARPGHEHEPWDYQAIAANVAEITAAQLIVAAQRWMPSDVRLVACGDHEDGAPAFGKLRHNRLIPHAGKP